MSDRPIPPLHIRPADDGWISYREEAFKAAHRHCVLASWLLRKDTDNTGEREAVLAQSHATAALALFQLKTMLGSAPQDRPNPGMHREATP